jgi:hypothetical protein
MRLQWPRLPNKARLDGVPCRCVVAREASTLQIAHSGRYILADLGLHLVFSEFWAWQALAL